jgi:hypothetical protein
VASGDGHVVVVLGECHCLGYPVAPLLLNPRVVDVHAHRFVRHRAKPPPSLNKIPSNCSRYNHDGSRELAHEPDDTYIAKSSLKKRMMFGAPFLAQRSFFMSVHAGEQTLVRQVGGVLASGERYVGNIFQKRYECYSMQWPSWRWTRVVNRTRSSVSPHHTKPPLCLWMPAEFCTPSTNALTPTVVALKTGMPRS